MQSPHVLAHSAKNDAQTMRTGSHAAFAFCAAPGVCLVAVIGMEKNTNALCEWNETTVDVNEPSSPCATFSSPVLFFFLPAMTQVNGPGQNNAHSAYSFKLNHNKNAN